VAGVRVDSLDCSGGMCVRYTADKTVQGAGCRVQGSGCRVQGAGCRVQGTPLTRRCAPHLLSTPKPCIPPQPKTAPLK
jgi:hypothetical protein